MPVAVDELLPPVHHGRTFEPGVPFSNQVHQRLGQVLIGVHFVRQKRSTLVGQLCYTSHLAYNGRCPKKMVLFGTLSKDFPKNIYGFNCGDLHKGPIPIP